MLRCSAVKNRCASGTEGRRKVGHMFADLIAALEPLAQRWQAQAAQDEALRRFLVVLGRTLLELAEPAEKRLAAPPNTTVAEASPSPRSTSAATSGMPTAATPPAITGGEDRPRSSLAAQLGISSGWSHFPIVELPPRSRGGESPSESLADRRPHGVEPPEEILRLITRRCRLKAEGARWAGERQRLLSQGVDFKRVIAPRDEEILNKARAERDCFLWTSHPETPTPLDRSAYELLAVCYETVAAAAEMLLKMVHNPHVTDEKVRLALYLSAEAQCQLRWAAKEFRVEKDRDQMDMYFWLLDCGKARHIPIPNYMRRESYADPRGSLAIRQKIEELAEEFGQVNKQAVHRKKLLSKLKHRTGLILDHPLIDHTEDWEGIFHAIEGLLEGGTPPSSKEIRDFLLPIIDKLPRPVDALPRSMQLVVREIERFRQSVTERSEPDEEDDSAAPLSEEVQQLRELLQKRALVLIGGDERPEARQALESAFDLSELIWIPTKQHQSYTTFEPMIGREDVAVVVLAIRWASHDFTRACEIADKYGKPFVRLPAGYSANQMAHHILEQAGSRLRGEDHPPG